MRALRSPPKNDALRQFIHDLRRNPGGGDDYPWEIMRGVADRLDEIISTSPEAPPPRKGVSEKMIDAALNAWFASPPSETDQGLERSMKAALEAALRYASSSPP